MRHRFNGFPVRCISLLLILGGLGGHRAAGQSNAGPTPRFNVETTLVLIPATVTDKLNRFVLGLHKEDFRLFEDGVEQTISPAFPAKTCRSRWALSSTPAAAWVKNCESHARLCCSF